MCICGKTSGSMEKFEVRRVFHRSRSPRDYFNRQNVPRRFHYPRRLYNFLLELIGVEEDINFASFPLFKEQRETLALRFFISACMLNSWQSLVFLWKSIKNRYFRTRSI